MMVLRSTTSVDQRDIPGQVSGGVSGQEQGQQVLVPVVVAVLDNLHLEAVQPTHRHVPPLGQPGAAAVSGKNRLLDG